MVPVTTLFDESKNKAFDAVPVAKFGNDKLPSNIVLPSNNIWPVSVISSEKILIWDVSAIKSVFNIIWEFDALCKLEVCNCD